MFSGVFPRCGGEKGIRTLDTVPRIHDFQSCALDQLSHLSTFNYSVFSADMHDFQLATLDFQLYYPFSVPTASPQWFHCFQRCNNPGIFLRVLCQKFPSCCCRPFPLNRRSTHRTALDGDCMLSEVLAAFPVLTPGSVYPLPAN